MKKLITTLFAASIILGSTGAAFAADRNGRDHRGGDRGHGRVEHVAPQRRGGHNYGYSGPSVEFVDPVPYDDYAVPYDYPAPYDYYRFHHRHDWRPGIQFRVHL